MSHRDLRLRQIVCMLVFYNISFSRLLPLDGFPFSLLRDSENDVSVFESQGHLGEAAIQINRVDELQNSRINI